MYEVGFTFRFNRVVVVMFLFCFVREAAEWWTKDNVIQDYPHPVYLTSLFRVKKTYLQAPY